jgi:16S rRNA (guanine527-N7)-methyltransferase
MEKLVRAARELFNVHITGRQVMSLITYEKELLAWNQKFNLTAIRDSESIRAKHFLDSFSCVLAWKANPPASLIDVGAGAGFPGLALKILYPNLKLTVVDSVGKKAMFCQHIVGALGLSEVSVIQARAEDLGHNKNHREALRLGSGARGGEPQRPQRISVAAGQSERDGARAKRRNRARRSGVREEGDEVVGW